MKNYIEPTQEAGRKFFTSDHIGQITMLNLLRFKEKADYTDSPELMPEKAGSGASAYLTYMKCATPLIEKAGSKVLFSGKPSGFLIGPEDENWDYMLLVSHLSKESFLAFASDEAYLKIAGHRTAALEDSRLLPLVLD